MSDRGTLTQAPPSQRWGDLGTRLVSGLVLVSIAVITARVGGDVFVLAWLAAGIAVLWEWQRMIGGVAHNARVAIGAVGLALAASLDRQYVLDAFVVLCLTAGLVAYVAGRGARFWASSGVLYAGLLVMATLGLRFSFPFGSRSIIWLFATVWATDTFAYLGGRLIGGPKVWPAISPSKTWSGTLTGLAFGSAIGTFSAVRDLPAPTAVAPIFVVTLFAAIFSQLGDALESAIKRRFGVKDSSQLIPGHGGFMDRLDGFIAAAAFAFCLGLLRDLPSVAGGLFYWGE
jgi:phosphatidate cytidylyltransferase